MLKLKKAFIAIALSSALLPLGAVPAVAQSQAAETTEVAMQQGQEQLEADATATSFRQEMNDMENLESDQTNQRMTREEKAAAAKENDSWGGGITIISMSVVVGALAVLSILFLIFGKISTAMMSHKKMKTTGVKRSDAEKHHHEPDSGETIAAIALAMSEHFYNRRHDLEDTILTIKRMRRNYSPWNSKIYNLRQTPTLQRNTRR